MDLVNPLVRRWLEEADEDPEGFWARAAAELPWLRRWDRTFVWEPPSFRWFVGGETNLAHAALDHHVASGRGGHAALVWASERGERRVLTYAQLLHEVERLAAAFAVPPPVAGAPPLYGTWMPVVPVFCQKSAAVRWSDDPAPLDANVILSGFFFR